MARLTFGPQFTVDVVKKSRRADIPYVTIGDFVVVP
jgi:hypothetical protein